MSLTAGASSLFGAVSRKRVILVAFGAPTLAFVVAAAASVLLLDEGVLTAEQLLDTRTAIAAVAALAIAPTMRVLLHGARKEEGAGLLARAGVSPWNIVATALILSAWREGVVVAGLAGSVVGATILGADAEPVRVAMDLLTVVALWTVVAGSSLLLAGRSAARGTETHQLGWIVSLLAAAAVGGMTGPIISVYGSGSARIPLPLEWIGALLICFLILGVFMMVSGRKQWRRQQVIHRSYNPAIETAERPKAAHRTFISYELHHMRRSISGRVMSIRNISVLIVFFIAGAVSVNLAGEKFSLGHGPAFGIIIPLGAMVIYAAVADIVEPESDSGPIRLLLRIPGALRRQWRVRICVALSITLCGALISAVWCRLVFDDSIPLAATASAASVWWLTGVYVSLLVGYARVRRRSLPWPDDLPLTGLLMLPGLVLGFAVAAGLMTGPARPWAPMIAVILGAAAIASPFARLPRGKNRERASL